MMNSSVYDGDRGQNWSSSDENGEKVIQVGHANKICFKKTRVQVGHAYTLDIYYIFLKGYTLWSTSISLYEQKTWFC